MRIAALFAAILEMTSIAAHAEPLCQTTFARIAKVEVQKLVDQQKDTACKKLNLLGLDKTKELKINSLDICEDGSKVSAKVDFSFSCATPDGALIQATVGSGVKAQASANFHTCDVDVTKLGGSHSAVQQALDAVGGKAILSGFIASKIVSYCDR